MFYELIHVDMSDKRIDVNGLVAMEEIRREEWRLGRLSIVQNEEREQVHGVIWTQRAKSGSFLVCWTEICFSLRSQNYFSIKPFDK